MFNAGRWLRIRITLLLALATIGCLDAAFLSYAHLTGTRVCGDASGCDAVLASPYSEILGVPLSVIGLGFYLAVALLARRAGRPGQCDDAMRSITCLAVTGNLTAGYLVYLQGVVIGRWCPFCLVSAGLMAGILLICLWDRSTRGAGRVLRVPSVRVWMRPVLAAALLPGLLFLTASRFISAGEAGAGGNDPRIVARIGERVITADEMDYALRGPLYQIERRLYETRKRWLEEQLLTAEAERRGVSVDELFDEEVTSRISITRDEIAAYYRERRSDPRVTQPISPRAVAAYLRKQKVRTAREGLLDRLKTEDNVEFLITKPAALALEANPRGGPEHGSPEAKLTIVEFSDFECPHCARTHQRLKDFVEEHSDEIRVVFRHFPLAMHPHARQAAAAAACAHEQGKFWEYADLLFAHQGDLGESELYDYAEQAGLDVDRLRSCVESGRGDAEVDADLADGRELGVRSTPSLFLNGHSFRGAPTREQLESRLAEITE